MDDILKRMLAVEGEADKIVSDAQREAEKILEDGRQKANTILADAQLKLASDVESLMKSRIDAALADKVQKLEEVDKRLEKDVSAFRAKIEGRRGAALKVLLYPDAEL